MMYTMVIADDEPLVLKSTELFLKKEFPEIEIIGMAENGIQLKEMLERQKPDMAIVDIRMPGLSGIEVIELLRHKKCQTHFIISTAYSDFEYVKKALDLKTDGYLLKPSKREEKLEVIGRLCQTIEKEKQENIRQSGIRSALDVVNPVLGSEILMSVFTNEGDQKGFEAYCNINNIHFSAGCIATFLPKTKTDLSKRQLNNELEKCLSEFGKFLATVTSKGVVVMFFIPEQVSREQRKNWCNDLAALVSEYLQEHTGVEYLYGIGNVYETFKDMPASYKDSVITLRLNHQTKVHQPGDSADKIQDYVERTKQYIEVWFRKDISLVDCAQSVGISPYYLSHIFKERTGMTFVECLSRVRVSEAKRLCLETDLTLNEISEQCGYMNVTYFCKVFKRMTGMTISEFRKNSK